ncbi:hypothetical protein OIU76_010253 [Salix suchowensis]|nr:hypothetical protein OIU76_010253 [Salix suchowensis]
MEPHNHPIICSNHTPSHFDHKCEHGQYSKSVSRAFTGQPDPLPSSVFSIQSLSLSLNFGRFFRILPVYYSLAFKQNQASFSSVLKSMAKDYQNYSWRLSLLVSCSLLVLLPFSSFHVQALNIGVQAADSAVSLVWLFDHLSNLHKPHCNKLIFANFFVFLRAKAVVGNASQSSVQCLHF